MIFTVYVLKSIKNGKRYVGYTGKTADERLHDHLTGSNPWTRANGPFHIVHTEEFGDKTEAIRRENYLKSGIGREWLDTFIPR
jgi:putative endonuclease